MKQKNNIFFIFIITFITNSCGSNFSPNDWQRKNLKGKVKSIITSRYKVLGNKNQWTTGKKYVSGERGYVYNNAGMLTEVHTFNNNQLIGKYTNTFDASNHLKESIRFSETGSLIEKIVGSFDKKKRLSIRKQYNFQNDLLGVVENYEDEQGNIVRRIAKNAKGKVNYRTEFEYNKKNQLIKQTSYSDNKKLYPNYTTQYKNYDKQGNFTLVEYYDKETNEKQIKIYQYKYDSNENWIEMIEFIENKATRLTKRTIEYY